MKPERWHQIDQLFDAALQVDHSEREEWLRQTCGEDGELRAELESLLAQDQHAARDGFLAPPELSEQAADFTPSWPVRVNGQRLGTPRSGDRHRVLERPDGSDGFTPKAAIALGTQHPAATETHSLARARLRDLAIVYLLIFAIMLYWRNFVVKNYDVTISSLYALAILVLSITALVLAGRRPLPIRRLSLLELGMIAMIATIFAFTQYEAMLQLSLRADPTRAQLVVKNRVLFAAILILSYGIYTPKSWRRAAFVVGPLAMLPFAVVLILYLRHPEAMGWLIRLGQERDISPIWLFGVDVSLLLILAVGTVSGARTMSRLRRQVAEAQQLGQYRLRQRIGAGGMGEVYLAEHQLLKRPCAIKLIRPGDSADPKALDRFEREVRITATLSHWNTVEIFDYGRTEDGTYYYVMEYLPGLSFAELVERAGPLPPGRVVYLVRQVCLALREAHAAGLIHRDIKPSNIFAARRGGLDDVSKLLDFGLVRPSPSAAAPDLSGESQILGTPLFMSPEQAMAAREVDERSDIYSLGAVSYHLLTGRPPFNEGSGIGVMIAHARDPVLPPSLIHSGIPDDLERVVLRCLAKDPADRFQNAHNLERALADCTCASDWDQDQAARWWRELERIATSNSSRGPVPREGPSAQEPVPGSIPDGVELFGPFSHWEKVG
jgi:eukaryotic-like serine/threonine-protein kinase